MEDSGPFVMGGFFDIRGSPLCENCGNGRSDRTTKDKNTTESVTEELLSMRAAASKAKKAQGTS